MRFKCNVSFCSKFRYTAHRLRKQGTKNTIRCSIICGQRQFSRNHIEVITEDFRTGQTSCGEQAATLEGRIVRLAEQKFAGNPGQVMFVIRDGGEGDNSRFIPIASQNEGDWQALHEQAVSDIVVAHSWFRTLSGLDYASGFSAERILHEYEVALNTVILGEQAELTEPVREAITSILGIDASSLQVINRPPTRSKPIYMKVWEARKADGLDYDPDDERQQAFLSEITKYNIRSIE